MNDKQNAPNENDTNLVPAQQFVKAEDGRPLLGATNNQVNVGYSFAKGIDFIL